MSTSCPYEPEQKISFDKCIFLYYNVLQKGGNNMIPLKDYLLNLGHEEEYANEIELEYQMILRIINDPNDLYDIVSWLGWFDEDEE